MCSIFRLKKDEFHLDLIIETNALEYFVQNTDKFSI